MSTQIHEHTTLVHTHNMTHTPGHTHMYIHTPQQTHTHTHQAHMHTLVQQTCCFSSSVITTVHGLLQEKTNQL